MHERIKHVCLYKNDVGSARIRDVLVVCELEEVRHVLDQLIKSKFHGHYLSIVTGMTKICCRHQVVVDNAARYLG